VSWRIRFDDVSPFLPDLFRCEVPQFEQTMLSISCVEFLDIILRIRVRGDELTTFPEDLSFSKMNRSWSQKPFLKHPGALVERYAGKKRLHLAIFSPQGIGLTIPPLLFFGHVNDARRDFQGISRYEESSIRVNGCTGSNTEEGATIYTTHFGALSLPIRLIADVLYDTECVDLKIA
jgi:hypothetical protein